MMREVEKHYDVVILGAGQAGLSLARHLLLDTDKTVLLVERRAAIPPRRQKVGESTVQVGGYYYGRVLDLEEYLLCNHYLKYNLRFCWKSSGRDNSRFEDYSQSFIRALSNVPSYQFDRNTLEAELLRRNLEEERFTFQAGIRELEVDLAEEGPHRVSFATAEGASSLAATWVVDTTGRSKFLAKQEDLERRNSIRHGSFFWWVEGLVDVDRLTDLSPSEIRKKKERRYQGHLPAWLATNHFCVEGVWFWVIPLQGKTSLGLVFDKEVVDYQDVGSVEKASRWVCEHFPCFARDLPGRKVLDYGGYADFSYDCAQTIAASRWAISGEAGRFSDPLYSPGSDLIAIHNTLIVDAVETGGGEELGPKCQLYEQLMRAVYQAYLPSYTVTYDTFGDPETFSLKYTWELTVYFAGYVFPFINDLFTDRRFILGFLRLFSRLGPINQNVQQFLSDYYRWKKANVEPPVEPSFHDFTDLGPLSAAEKTFYAVGVTADEAKKILARQVDNLEHLARYIVAHVASVVVGDERVLTNRRFVESIDVYDFEFDPNEIRQRYERAAGEAELHPWAFDPFVFQRFQAPARETAEEPMPKEVSS